VVTWGFTLIWGDPVKPAKRKGVLVSLPSDDVLVIRNGMPLFQPREHETHDQVSQDTLVLMGVARCFLDDEFRAMMRLVVRDAAKAGDLDGIIDIGVRQ
jgi:hypothetical protein